MYIRIDGEWIKLELPFELKEGKMIYTKKEIIRNKKNKLKSLKDIKYCSNKNIEELKIELKEKISEIRYLKKGLSDTNKKIYITTKELEDLENNLK